MYFGFRTLSRGCEARSGYSQPRLEFITEWYNNNGESGESTLFVPISMKQENHKSRGRPRAFERDDVLDRAIISFWAHGYNGASIDTLTKNMGINRPSLYGTFGSKHDLFMAAIDRYAMTLGCLPFSAFQSEAGVREAVADFFALTIRSATSKGKPKGCLIASVATIEAEKDHQVREKLSDIFAETDRVITDYFRAAQEVGRLPGGHEPQALARMVIAVTHSIATRARAGGSRKQLSVMVDDFMALLFPG